MPLLNRCTLQHWVSELFRIVAGLVRHIFGACAPQIFYCSQCDALTKEMELRLFERLRDCLAWTDSIGCTPKYCLATIRDIVAVHFPHYHWRKVMCEPTFRKYMENPSAHFGLVHDQSIIAFYLFCYHVGRVKILFDGSLEPKQFLLKPYSPQNSTDSVIAMQHVPARDMRIWLLARQIIAKSENTRSSESIDMGAMDVEALDNEVDERRCDRKKEHPTMKMPEKHDVKKLKMTKGAHQGQINLIKDSPTVLRSPPVHPRGPRRRFRVCVIGGGFAGLKCSLELLSLCEDSGLPIEVVLLEARSRLGGRVHTDTVGGIPVDLGANWIYGVKNNPVTALADEAGVNAVIVEPQAKLLGANRQTMTSDNYEFAKAFYDRKVANGIEVSSKLGKREDEAYPEQKSLKWYGEQLVGSGSNKESRPTDPPPHRMSYDITVEKAVSVAMTESGETKSFSPLVRRAALWHSLNRESAFGASTKDISIANYGFDAEHVQGGNATIPRGHAALIAQLEEQLKQKGDRFSCRLNCEVGSIHYNCTPILPTGRAAERGSVIPISDACRVESSDGSIAVNCDFVVCTLPLGVLKASLKPGHGPHFIPELPETKRDAIASLGFGLVNRVVLQFPEAFWRSSDASSEQIGVQFGNITGLHTQYYNFVDLGRLQPAPNGTFPAVLVTSFAGRDAMDMEKKSDEEIIQEVLEVLREIFTTVSCPTSYKVTHWGTDPFARGAYSFIPPGSSTGDFLTLQSPVHGNGDAIMTGSKHTARLFFAGEHTNMEHPCSTHGALLSGDKAAKQVCAAMQVCACPEKIQEIPLAIYRKFLHGRRLVCALCGKWGATAREGRLVSFRYGTTMELFHDQCAVYCADLEANILTRECQLSNCSLCSLQGASIPCKDSGCKAVYHFACAQDTGWVFTKDGSAFLCHQHRFPETTDARRVSIEFCRSLLSPNVPRCCFCERSDEGSSLGDLLGFLITEKDTPREIALVAHEACVRFSNITNAQEDEESVFHDDFKGISNLLKASRDCSFCGTAGSTMCCHDKSCGAVFHVRCVNEYFGCDLEREHRRFFCPVHEEVSSPEP